MKMLHRDDKNKINKIKKIPEIAEELEKRSGKRAEEEKKMKGETTGGAQEKEAIRKKDKRKIGAP